MQNLDKLATLVNALPESYQAARDLVTKMSTVIEGIGDRPIEWRPENCRVVQGTSDRSKLPKGAGIGSIVIGETLVEQPFAVIPIRCWSNRQYWNPDPDKTNMICNSPDAVVGFRYGKCRSCEFANFNKETNKPQCNKVWTMLCTDTNLAHVFLVQFAKSNYSNGNDWFTTMKTVGVASYKRCYNLSAATSTKSKNVELLNVAPSTVKPDEVILPVLEELFHISGLDRTEQLVKFYDYIKNKPSDDTPLLETAQNLQHLLTSEIENADVEEASVISETPAAAKGKKYAL